jgi:hypothetical protein
VHRRGFLRPGFPAEVFSLNHKVKCPVGANEAQGHRLDFLGEALHLPRQEPPFTAIPRPM